MLAVTLAQEAPAGGLLNPIVFMVLMVGVFWLFIIRPQRTRARKQQELVAALEPGDRVQTVGGIQGTVVIVEGDTVVLEVEQGRLRLARRAVGAKLESE